jgi:hypothetical protein
MGTMPRKSPAWGYPSSFFTSSVPDGIRFAELGDRGRDWPSSRSKEIKEEVLMRKMAATWGWLLALGLAVSTSQVLAQDLDERVTKLETAYEEHKADAEGALGIEINALVSTTYNYSFNEPDGSDNIGMRIYNNDHNSIDLRDAVLALSRLREDETFGFALVMDFGRTAVQGNGTDYGFLDDDDNRVFDIREAYLTYNTPIEIPGGGKISFKGGKFVTLLGWEVLLDPMSGGYNDNVSLSLLSGFSIPFTHTGILLNAPINDMLDFTIGVVNGNDVVQDNNDGKTLLAGLGIAPMDNLEFYVAGTYGGEEDPIADGGAGAGSKTGILTANMFLQATDSLAFVLDGTYADVSGVTLDNGRRGANWYGGGAYAIINLTDALQLTLRGEVFDDPDGIKTGLLNGATLWEVSPTISYWFNEHLLWRVEYRHDEANKPLFPADDGQMWRGQDVISTEILLTI